MERLAGLKSGDVEGQILFDLFPFLAEIGEDKMFRRALAGEEVSTKGRPFHVIATNRRGHFNGRYSPYRDDQGVIGIDERELVEPPCIGPSKADGLRNAKRLQAAVRGREVRAA